MCGGHVRGATRLGIVEKLSSTDSWRRTRPPSPFLLLAGTDRSGMFTDIRSDEVAGPRARKGVAPRVSVSELAREPAARATST